MSAGCTGRSGASRRSTDDAYVQADVVTIAPKVSGYIQTVSVDDNQPVKAGDVLAVIDPRDYQAAVDQAKADVAVAEATIASINAQLSRAAGADRGGQRDRHRRQGDRSLRRAERPALRHPGEERLRHACRTPSRRPRRRAPAKAIVGKDEAALAAAQKQVDDARRRSSRRPRRRSTTTARRSTQAELNLSYTVLRAPVDGVVGKRTLRVGQYVQPGQQLMAVVPLAGDLCRRQLQGDAAHRRRIPASRSRSRSTRSPAPACAATSTASRRPAARNSRCCRRTTPPATSPRSCSASR